MNRIFNFIVLYFIIFIDGSLSAKTSGAKQVTSSEDALAWLNKYGYNPCFNSDVQCSLSLTTIVRDYQKRFKLQITGKLDDTTKKHMNQPRCGIPDKPIAELNAVGTYKWSRSSLTYSITGYPTQLSQAQTNSIIRDAFQAWTKHVPLTIEQVCSSCKSDFVLDFQREKHTDSYAFDGPSGTLAHAFFPEDGRVHFDKDETWTDSFKDAGINLYLVAVHEIGHALGLDHVYDKESIMYPSYQIMQKEDILPKPDRLAIEALYGKKQSTSRTTSTSTTTTATARTTRIIRTTIATRRPITSTRSTVTWPSGIPHARCGYFLDTAFDHPDGTFHTFSAGRLWRYIPDENTWASSSTPVGRTYPNLPHKLSGGVYNKQKNEIFFFTDKEVYHYDVDSHNRARFKSRKNLAKNLRNSIVGAIYYDSQIYLITARIMRRFKLDSIYEQSNERPIRDEFPGFTGTVVKAFSNGISHHFFTSDRRVYVWSERLNTWETFAKPMATGWFACSGTDTYDATSNTEEVQRNNRQGSHRYHHHRHHHHQRHHRDHYEHNYGQDNF